MKLHLPKQLFTALLTALTLAAPAAWAFDGPSATYIAGDLTDTDSNTTNIIELTASVDTTYNLTNSQKKNYKITAGSSNIQLVGPTNTNDAENYLDNVTASSLWFAGGSFQVDQTTDLSGAGCIYVGGGQVQFTSSMELNNNFIIGSTTVNTDFPALNTALRIGHWQTKAVDIKLLGDITVQENSSIGFQNSALLTLGNLSGSGDISLSRYDGSSTLTLAGTSTQYTGVLNTGTSGVGIKLGTEATTLGGLTGSSSVSLAEGTTTSTLTLNVAAGRDLSFAGSIGSEGSTGITLVKSGAGSQTLGGNVQLDSLTVSGGSLTVGSGASLSIGSTIVNNGTLTLNGTVTIAKQLTANYTQNGYNGEMVLGADTLGGSGTYTVGSNLTINGINVLSISEGDGGAYSLSTTGTVYHVVNGTAKLGEENLPTSTNSTHTGYEVHSGATLDINGKQANGQFITLQGGSFLTNSGSDVSDATGVNKQQASKIELKGDASLTNTGQMGIISGNWGSAEFSLNGYTFTKTGDGLFSVSNATISAGTIDVQAGKVQLDFHANSYNAKLSIDSGLKVKLAANTELSITGAHSDMLNADFLLNTTGSGTITIHRDVNVGSSGGDTTFSGNISVTAGTLQLGNAGNGASEMEELEFSTVTLDMDGGNFRYFGGSSTIGTLNVNATPNSFVVYGTNAGSSNLGTLTFNKVNVAAEQHLVMSSHWDTNVHIGALTGKGDLSITHNTSYSSIENTCYTVDSVASGFGSITNAGTLNLGAAGQTVTLGHKVVNTGSITLDGTLIIENLDGEHFDIVDGTFYSSATNHTAETVTLSGYAGASKYQIINGTVTRGENFSYTGTCEFDAQKGLLVSAGNTDTTRFYVNENIKWGVAGTDNDIFTTTVYTDRTAETYVVGADVTLDLNFGNTNNTHGWDGKIFELQEGAILANSGVAGNTSWQQLYRIDLKGNAKLDASENDYGFLASNYGESILNLNGYTLEKTGGSTFRMITTSINAGTIKITDGAVQIGAVQATTQDVTATDVDFVLNGGNLNFYNNDNALTTKSISGTGNINDLTNKTGELTLVGNSGTHTITGNIGLNKLNLLGSNSYTMAGSMAIGDQLNVSNGKLELTTGSSSFATTTLSGGTLQVTGGSMTQSDTFNQTGGTLQIDGGTVTFDGLLNGTGGIANLMGGNISFNNTSAANKVNNFDVAGPDASTAQVSLAENVTLQVNGSMWLGKTAAIKLAENARLEKDGMAIIGTGNDSSVTRLSSGDSNSFGHGSDDHGVTNARIEMTKTGDAALNLLLTGVDVTNAGSGTLSVNNASNTISNLAAENGNVKLTASMSVDSISANTDKTVTVTNGSTIAMGNGSVSIGTNGADATLRATSDNALMSMQSATSFSISDMVLSNVKLSAVEGASVVLNNVSGTAELAGAGSYTLGMTPAAQVGAIENDNGSTAPTLSYSSGLAITMSSTDSQLLLSADPTVDANGVFGTYNLTLTLYYTLDGIGVPETATDWRELVSFTGILGDLLTAQAPVATVDLSEGEAAVAAADTTPTVEYTYTAPEGNAQVGTLVITISGLNVPEPTTSTLSLLALAALCARRRRK